MYEPLKVAFGQYLGQFFAGGIAPTTRYLTEYVRRPLNQAILWAPGRMVDLAEEMLAAWQKDDSRGSPTAPYTMPIILVAIAKDATQSGPGFARSLGTPGYVVLPDDPKDRLFKLRTFTADLRAQLAIAAHDEPTARALASQVLLWLEAFPNRSFRATYRFAGFDLDWPVQVALPENPASLIATDAKNLTLLSLDILLRPTVPLYQAPRPGEPNDGLGDPNNPDDPAGYPFLVEIDQNGERTITDPQPPLVP